MDQGKSNILTKNIDSKDESPWIPLCKSALAYSLYFFYVPMIPNWLTFHAKWNIFAVIVIVITVIQFSLYVFKNILKINHDLIKTYPKIFFTLLPIFFYFWVTIYQVLSSGFRSDWQIGLTIFLVLIPLCFWYKEIGNKLRGIK